MPDMRTSLGAILFGAFAQPELANMYTIGCVPPVQHHPKISCSEVRAVPLCGPASHRPCPAWGTFGLMLLCCREKKPPSENERHRDSFGAERRNEEQGERLAFSRGEEEGQTRKQYACTDVKASAHGVLPRRSAGKHQESPQVIAKDTLKTKSPRQRGL